MKKLSQLIQESEDNKTKAMVNNDKKQFYFVVTVEKPEPGWKFVKYSAPSEKVSSVLKSQGYKELNESLSLKRFIKEAEQTKQWFKDRKQWEIARNSIPADEDDTNFTKDEGK